MHQPKGCLKCKNTGYRGRVGIMEVLRITPRIKELIVQKAPEAQIKNTARREGMRTLRENGLAKVIRGETSVEEVLRVTVPDGEIS